MDGYTLYKICLNKTIIYYVIIKENRWWARSGLQTVQFTENMVAEFLGHKVRLSLREALQLLKSMSKINSAPTS